MSKDGKTGKTDPCQMRTKSTSRKWNWAVGTRISTKQPLEYHYSFVGLIIRWINHWRRLSWGYVKIKPSGGEKGRGSEPAVDSHFGKLTREATRKSESRPMADY